MDRRLEDDFFLNEFDSDTGIEQTAQKEPRQPYVRQQHVQQQNVQQHAQQPYVQKNQAQQQHVQKQPNVQKQQYERTPEIDSFSFDDGSLHEQDSAVRTKGSRAYDSRSDAQHTNTSYSNKDSRRYVDDDDREDAYAAHVDARMRQEKKDRRRHTRKIIGGVFSWIKDLAIALLIVWFVLTFVAQNNKVIGTSMQPTVYANDVVLVNKFIYRFTDPERGDIIVFPTEEDGETINLIKRIVGLPGDEIDIQDGCLYINGVLYEEDYISVETTAIDGQVTFPLTVPEGEYFVLGDNRTVSKDSRYTSVGTIAKSEIIGKVSIRIWPLDSIGFIR